MAVAWKSEWVLSCQIGLDSHNALNKRLTMSELYKSLNNVAHYPVYKSKSFSFTVHQRVCNLRPCWLLEKGQDGRFRYKTNLTGNFSVNYPEMYILTDRWALTVCVAFRVVCVFRLVWKVEQKKCNGGSSKSDNRRFKWVLKVISAWLPDDTWWLKGDKGQRADEWLRDFHLL